jgi:phytoene dehydrogenase-like protein
VGVPGFATYYCTTAAPQFIDSDPDRSARGSQRSAVSAGLAGWPEDMIQMCADLRTGRFISDPPWVLVATPTLVDPGRAPAGRHTVKILLPAIYQPQADLGD